MPHGYCGSAVEGFYLFLAVGNVAVHRVCGKIAGSHFIDDLELVCDSLLGNPDRRSSAG